MCDWIVSNSQSGESEMATKFQQKKIYRDLDLFEITTLTEQKAWERLKTMRWGHRDEVCCPECNKWDKHYFISTRKHWTCKFCSWRFSVTSSTPFSNRKISLVKLLTLIYFFVTGAQGESANAFHPKLGVTLKTVFHNFAKIREALFETMNLTPLEGLVHIDCAHFCGKPRRANKRKKTDSYVVNNKLRSRKDGIVPDKSTHPEQWNIDKLENRRIVLAMSQVDLSSPHAGSNRTITRIIKAENAHTILPLIAKYVSKDAFIMTDSGSAFQPILRELHIAHTKVNHSVEYRADDGTNNNMAEAFFSRMRRAEFGTYNGMRKQYFAFFTAEFGWRNDTRNMSLLQRFEDAFRRIFTREGSKAFCNYNHGKRLESEYLN